MQRIKIFVFLCVAIASIWFYPQVSLAQQRKTLIGNLIVNVISTFNMLVTLLFIVALLVFAWGIIRMILASSQGPQALQEAKGILLWGIIGMAVLASIGGIVLFVQQFFGVDSNAVIQAPQFQGTGL